MITLQTKINRELLPSEADENIRDLAERTSAGWKDLVSPLSPVGVPLEFVPEWLPFGPSGLRQELHFAVGDYAFIKPMHMNHDIKVGGKIYPHIHWSSSGTDVNPIKWEFQISRAKGHDQEYFGGETSLFVETAPNQIALGAWRHYVSEVSDSDAIDITEPDELILITIRRVSNGATENLDNIFGLTVDLHYEADRDTTPNKAPNFYI